MDSNEILSFRAYCIYDSRVTAVDCVLIERERAVIGVCRASDGSPRYKLRCWYLAHDLFFRS